MDGVRTYSLLRAQSGLRVICAADGERYPLMVIWMYVSDAIDTYILYCTVLHCTALCNIFIRYTTMNCVVLYCATLHITIL